MPEASCNPTVTCMLSFSTVLSAAPHRSLRGRLQSLGESDWQMCHQVNLSDSSSKNSSAYCPSLPNCALVLKPLIIVSFHSCSPFIRHFSAHSFPSVCVLFHAFHPLLFCEVTALVSLISDVLLSFCFFLLFCFDVLPLFSSFKELWIGSFSTCCSCAWTDWTQIAWKSMSKDARVQRIQFRGNKAL